MFWGRHYGEEGKEEMSDVKRELKNIMAPASETTCKALSGNRNGWMVAGQTNGKAWSGI